MDVYKIAATGNSINYLPQYVAETRGIFEDLQLSVKTEIPQPWTGVLKLLDENKCQAVCGGIWVPAMMLCHKVKHYMTIAKISSRCPYKLVGREPVSSWQELEGKTIVIPCDGGASAYIFLVGILQSKGINTDKINFIHDLTENILNPCFELGKLGDFYFTAATNANRILATGSACEIMDMAVSDYIVPWSVYYSTLEFHNNNLELNTRFSLGIKRGIQYVLDNPATEFVDILQSHWPANDLASGIETIERFKKLGMWQENIQVSEYEHNRYQEFQLAAGILNRHVSRAELVDIELMNSVDNWQSTEWS